jgi:hypothetical protein
MNRAREGMRPLHFSGCRDVPGNGAWPGNRFSIFPHACQVHLHGLAHEFGGFHFAAGRDASWKVWKVRTVAGRCLLEQDGVSHRFSPACFKMLFRVFGFNYIEGWPAPSSSFLQLHGDFFRLPPGALNSVIIGCRADHRAIAALIRENASELPIKRAVPSPNIFKLKVVDYLPT